MTWIGTPTCTCPTTWMSVDPPPLCPQCQMRATATQNSIDARQLHRYPALTVLTGGLERNIQAMCVEIMTELAREDLTIAEHDAWQVAHQNALALIAAIARARAAMVPV